MTSPLLVLHRTAALSLGVMVMCAHAFALRAEVKPLHGSPTIFLDGKPTSPLTFFGWAESSGPVSREIGTRWQEVWYTFVAPEDTKGQSGIHFRMGGFGPGTVWVDNVRFYRGPKVDNPAENWVRQGDFEGTREEITREWSFYQAKYAGADADWSLDRTTSVTGKQSLRVDIRNAGHDTMHLHWYQVGYSMRKGQQYTYSLWMKADKPRNIDFMALHIGEPWTIYGGPNSVYQQQVALARDAGVHIYSFGIPMPWPRPGEAADFSGVDACLQTTLDLDPNALLLPRFGATPPGWWLDQHPDDKMLFDDGQTLDVCMASEAWRRDMQAPLRALVRHCEQQYGAHMLGYHPCGQHTGEWFYQRSWEPRLSDFSVCMSKGFARWARGRYGTVAALRQAWGSATVTFEQITVPTKEEQLHTGIGLFRDPRRERRVIDYFEFKQVAMEEPLEMMARVIKEETAGGKLVCFFYGYLFDMHGLPLGPQGSGHLAMSRLVRCPDVDVVCSPISYLDREQGGAGCFMSAVDSVRLSGKLWLNEDDTRTYLTAPADGYGRVETPQGTVWVHQRNFAQLWPRRLACWYMDLGNAGWVNGKDLWDNIGEMQRFYQGRIQEPARWAPQVAVIVDEASPDYTRCGQPFLRPLVYEMRSQLNRLGAPVGFYLLSDLVAGKLPPTKTYLFLNCFHLDAAQRAAIRQATRGQTAVWFYGGGFLTDEAASEANMTDATGLSFARLTPRGGAVTTASKAGLCEGLPEKWGPDTDWGQAVSLDPAWGVTDADARPLARFADGAVAAAARETPEGLRVYLGTLSCPAKLLRNIVKASGVHVYCDSDDVVLTDGEFLCLSASSAGPKELRFPRRCTVTRALDGTVVARDVESLKVNMQWGETQMWVLQ